MPVHSSIKCLCHTSASPTSPNRTSSNRNPIAANSTSANLNPALLAVGAGVGFAAGVALAPVVAPAFAAVWAATSSLPSVSSLPRPRSLALNDPTLWNC